MAYITAKIKNFDKAVFKYAGLYRPKINPSNSYEIIKQINKKNLKFEYDQNNIEFNEAIEYLQNLKVPKSIFNELFKAKLAELQIKFKLVQTTNSEDLFKCSKELYGFPSKKLIDKAYSLLALPDDPEEKTIPLDHAKEILYNQLQSFKIDWKVYGKKMLAYASVRPEKKEIKLNPEHQFSEKGIKRLAVHEIGTHGVRAMNARMQPLRIFKNFPGYLATEEGLAVFNEKITGLLGNNDIKKYAARTIAVDYAKDHTLSEVYKLLSKYLNKETAAVTALRVKRGLPNSESLGCYTKDYVYLKGFFDVYNYSKKHDLKALYYGKINLKYIDLIKKVEPELTKIKYFPPIIQSFEIKKDVFS
jgi:uncharacterized protein (TIGR02421 family)